MALVSKIARVRKEHPKVHKATTCELSTFIVDGGAYLQLDTFGSKDRQEKGEVSQSIQFDRSAMIALRSFIDEALKAGR